MQNDSLSDIVSNSTKLYDTMCFEEMSPSQRILDECVPPIYGPCFMIEDNDENIFNFMLLGYARGLCNSNIKLKMERLKVFSDCIKNPGAAIHDYFISNDAIFNDTCIYFGNMMESLHETCLTNSYDPMLTKVFFDIPYYTPYYQAPACDLSVGMLEKYWENVTADNNDTVRNKVACRAEWKKWRDIDASDASEDKHHLHLVPPNCLMTDTLDVFKVVITSNFIWRRVHDFSQCIWTIPDYILNTCVAMWGSVPTYCAGVRCLQDSIREHCPYLPYEIVNILPETFECT